MTGVVSAGPLDSTGGRTGPCVRELLESPVFRGAQIIAGAAGTGRIVRSATVMEVREILPWVKPHSVLVTTGYPLRHTSEDLGRLIAELDDLGLSGLLIKLNRYITDVPRDALVEADWRGFPVVRLPDDLLFDDLLAEVLQRALDHQASVLRRSEEVHQTLIDLVLRGPHEVVAATADLLGADGALAVDTDGAALGWSGDVLPRLHEVCACSSPRAARGRARDPQPAPGQRRRHLGRGRARADRSLRQKRHASH